MRSDSVVLAYPYEGAFYWFLAAGAAHSQSHNYYKLLYGENPEALSARAAAIASLYPRIILTPADAQLPDLRTYMVDRDYSHPHLGISMSYKDNEWEEEIQELARRIADDESVEKLLERNKMLGSDKSLWHHFLCRSILQVRLAAQSQAVIVGDTFFQSLYSLIAPWILDLARAAPVSTTGSSKLTLDQNVISLVGLDFSPADIDAFAAIRGSREVARYAKSFREALSQADSEQGLEQALIDLMAEAMDDHEIATKASSAFETVGTAMNVTGFVPVLGTASSIVGLGMEAASRAAQLKARKLEWFLLGAKLKEVVIRDLLSRRRPTSEP